MKEEFGDEVAMIIGSSSENRSKGEWRMPEGEAVTGEARVARKIANMTSIRHRSESNKIGAKVAGAETFISNLVLKNAFMRNV